jgi:hypothetical protein
MLYGEKPVGTIFVRCGMDTVEGTAAAAAADGRSVSDYVRRMLEANLRAIEESMTMQGKLKEVKNARKRVRTAKARTRKRAKRAKLKRGSASLRTQRGGKTKRGSKRARSGR